MESRCPITFGPLSKLLLIPFFLALNQTLYNIFVLFYPGKSNSVLGLYCYAIGFMLNIIIPHIKYFSTKTKKVIPNAVIVVDKNKCCSKKRFLHYFLLMFLFDLEVILLIIPSILGQSLSKSNSASKLPLVVGAFTRESLIIVFMAIISYFLLKYKYYIHNNISLVSFIIMGVIIDLMLDNFQQEFEGKSITIIVINLISIVVSVINLCYIKYMIDILYYSYYNMAFMSGLSLFVLTSIALPYFLINEKQKEIMINLFDDKGILISRFIIYILLQFFFSLLRMLTLAYFTPNHYLICLIISKCVSTLITKETSIKYLIIIPFVFQFLSLMVYLEIIELNFCGLNKNTKTNINIRGEEDMLLRNVSRNSTLEEMVEFPGGYILNKSSQYTQENEEDNSSRNSLTEISNLGNDKDEN